ncbi:uncharacterized protein LOC101889106 [Musca domestica]|uniref:Uncharacterized protein LOC101889106 n=1 Tax=Musca domestica TaxID=7370 RepID=A0A1I8M5K5_MUSDO|nr:uncharacterized protein LOC101889106 [Musca domestica]
MCDHNGQITSETKDNFKQPKLKRPPVTRTQRFEQFLWQEIYDEYIRHNERLTNVGDDNATTEYFDEFCKDMPTEDVAAKEAVINRYPLYCTTAITLWNTNGDITKDFKKRYSITRPVEENSEQFG